MADQSMKAYKLTAGDMERRPHHVLHLYYPVLFYNMLPIAVTTNTTNVSKLISVYSCAIDRYKIDKKVFICTSIDIKQKINIGIPMYCKNTSIPHGVPFNTDICIYTLSHYPLSQYVTI